ncbi:hypothetical protein DXG01_008408 [Tephrocybe rancida]|nr:hypothetical protein DXG01_008408 [Tephrocybe rancida]
MTTLTSHAPPIPSPVHTGIAAELEPDIAWKDALRAKIEDDMATMVEDAKKRLQSELNKGPASVERREILIQEYQRTMNTLRALAQNTFGVELEQERQERRWANDALVQEQQDIMNRIKGVQNGSQSSSTTKPPAVQLTEARPIKRASPVPVTSPAMPDDSDMATQEPARERREVLPRGLERLLREGSISVPQPSPALHASSSSSSPKPRTGSMNSTISTLTPSLHPPSAHNEAGRKRRREENFQQRQERFRKEQLRLEEIRQRTDSHKLTKEQVASTLERHERQWSILHSTGNNLHWESIPWPMFVPPKSLDDITLSAVSAYALTPLLPEEHNAKSWKDRIKDLIRKWHPDRFETKYLPRVAERDRDKVKEGIEAVLQSLNDMLMKETEQAVHPKWMDRVTTRENEVESARDELETWLEGVLRREKLVAARECEVRRMEQASMRRAEAAKRLEEEALKMKQEATAKKKKARQREEETGRREEEVNRREEEATRKEKEAKRKEDGLKSRERAAKAKVAKLELLIAKAQQSITLLKLRSIFLDVTARYYRRLLQCDGRDAQTILDTFQSLLDTDAAVPDRGQLIVAMRRLSAKTQLYPQRYLIDGPVELVHEYPVDAGKFADIYKANFQGNLTCLKVIRVHAAALAQHMAKVYAREAILWGQLSHPNLLPFYGLHTFRSQIAFVAPWAEKGNLSHYLIQEPNANRVLLCADTAAGVEYLHANGVVHGDLKALNILVDGFGRACLSDFGLSGVADPEIIKWTTQSSAASKGGTSRWQAPELHDPDIDNIHNSKESDVFAWASTSYEVFTGNPPFFEINSETRVTLMILRGDVPTRPPLDDKTWTARGLTEKIWEVLKECWRTQPSERPGISAVKSRIDNEKPAEDPRPPGQWGSGLAMRFRNAQEASIRDKRPSLEDLDVILSRVMDEAEAVDDEVE